MTPEDVGYYRTSLIFWCSLFGFIFYFSCYYFVSVFCRIFPLKLLFIGIVIFVNLRKTIPDFLNRGGIYRMPKLKKNRRAKAEKYITFIIFIFNANQVVQSRLSD